MAFQGFVTSPGATFVSGRGSNASAFGGRAVTSLRPPQEKRASPGRATIHMKKSRFRQPAQPQPQSQTSLPEDGTPVFAIFVRTPRAKMWYPLGAVKGDERSKSLVDALKSGFLRSMYANTLDKGIAQTVYGKDRQRFLQNATRMYPQLKKYVKELEFGYKVAAVGLDEQPTKVLTPDMSLSFFSWAKKQLNNTFKGTGS